MINAALSVSGPNLFLRNLNGGNMALDAARKQQLGTGEASAFMSQIGTVKAFAKEDGLYGIVAYTIFKDVQDGDAGTKAAAVHAAVKKITDKGVAIPNGLKVYCTKAYAAQNRAFSRDSGWNSVANVILGPAALTGGRPDALSATGLGGCNKPTITCIHEIGHILHENGLGDTFWETGSIVAGSAGKAATAGEVSGYAGQNKKEFVAEVFAGLILGKNFSANCKNEYTNLGGPAVP